MAIPNDFVPGTKAKANQVDANFTYVNDILNATLAGNIKTLIQQNLDDTFVNLPYLEEYRVDSTFFITTSTSDVTSGTFTMPFTVASGMPVVVHTIQDTYDEFNDSSFNTSLWTFDDEGQPADSSIAEGPANVVMTLANNNNRAGNFYSDNALFSATQNHVTCDVTAATGANVTWEIIHTPTGGAGTLELASEADGLGIFDFFYDDDASTIDVYRAGVFLRRITSANTFLKFRVHNGASTDATLSVNFVRKTASSPSSTVATKLSADNGSNFQTITNETVDAITNTGTQVSLRYSVTISGTEFVNTQGFGFWVGT